MKKLIVLAIFICTSLLSYFGYQSYRSSQVIEAFAPHVKNTSLRIGNELDYELDKNTNITYKEIFKKLEDDISEMDKRSLEVQTLANESNKDISVPTVEYIKAGQVLSRALLSYNKKSLETQASISMIDRRLDAARSSVGTYGSTYALKLAQVAIKDAEKALAERQESSKNVLESVSNLKESREVLVKFFPSETLISQEKLDEISIKFSPKDSNSKDGAKK